jgi:hypothetical protein
VKTFTNLNWQDDAAGCGFRDAATMPLKLPDFAESNLIDLLVCAFSGDDVLLQSTQV